jgi:hypothetical protein
VNIPAVGATLYRHAAVGILSQSMRLLSADNDNTCAIRQAPPKNSSPLRDEHILRLDSDIDIIIFNDWWRGQRSCAAPDKALSYD